MSNGQNTDDYETGSDISFIDYSDIHYDDTEQNTGTDVFTLEYKYCDIEPDTNHIYNIYDNYFDHLDELNIIRLIIKFLINDDIINLLKYRILDKFWKNNIDNYIEKFNNNDIFYHIRHLQKNNNMLLILNEKLLNIPYFKKIYNYINFGIYKNIFDGDVVGCHRRYSGIRTRRRLQKYDQNIMPIKIFKMNNDITKRFNEHILITKIHNKVNKKILERNRLSINLNKWINFSSYLICKNIILF